MESFVAATSHKTTGLTPVQEKLKSLTGLSFPIEVVTTDEGKHIYCLYFLVDQLPTALENESFSKNLFLDVPTSDVSYTICAGNNETHN